MALAYTSNSIPTGPTITGRPNIVQLSVEDSSPSYVRGVQVADATLMAGSGLDIEVRIAGQSFRIKSGASATYIDGVVTIATTSLFNTVPPVMMRYFRVGTAAGVSQLVAIRDGEVVEIINYASANYTAITSTNQTLEGSFDVAVYDKTFPAYRKLSATLRGAQLLTGGDETTPDAPVCKLDVSQLLHAAAMPVITQPVISEVNNLLEWYMRAQHTSMNTVTTEQGPCKSIFGVLPGNTDTLRISTNGVVLLTLNPRITLNPTGEDDYPVAKYQPMMIWVNVLSDSNMLRLVSFGPNVNVASDKILAQTIILNPWERTTFTTSGYERYRLRTITPEIVDIAWLALTDRQLCGDYEVLYLLNHFGLPETFVGVTKSIKSSADRVAVSNGFQGIESHNIAPVASDGSDMVVVTITELTEADANYVIDLLMLGQKAWMQPIRKDTRGEILPILISSKSIDKVYNGNAEYYDVNVEIAYSNNLGPQTGI